MLSCVSAISAECLHFGYGLFINQIPVFYCLDAAPKEQDGNVKSGWGWGPPADIKILFIRR